MDVDEVWSTIDEQRLEVADLLGTFSDADWETPSLCPGWRVRDVAAHLTLAQMGPLEATGALARAGFGFDRMIRDTAVRQARRPTEEYAGLLRAMAGSRRRAPMVTPLEPLIDVLVHAQDMVLPLGRELSMPVAAAAAATQRAWSMGFPFRAERRLRGVRLEATDHEWGAGAGELVTGPVQDLLLLVTGRRQAAVARLEGPGLRLVG